MLTRYASHKVLPPRAKPSAERFDRSGNALPGENDVASSFCISDDVSTTASRSSSLPCDSKRPRRTFRSSNRPRNIVRSSSSPADGFDGSYDEEASWSISVPGSIPTTNPPTGSSLRRRTTVSECQGTNDAASPEGKEGTAAVVGGGGERRLRPRLRCIPGRRHIHRPTKTVVFSIVQTRVYEVTKEGVDDKSGATPPNRSVRSVRSKSVEETRPLFLDDRDGGLEALCNSGSFGW
ncbi:hypothetical protein ACHAXA_002425 [Cyclostephanos tholiformis]|uniref:Uncharacterized protein n=1 Tax=Cyclostephanos tholiformis TaxID=382380 RepID=A0ABD3S024_9STRA